MGPVSLATLESYLGRSLDLDLVFGVADGPDARLFTFPPKDYRPRRVGFDCFDDLLQTRGCEAELVDAFDDLWALSHICAKHDAEPHET